MVHGSVRTSLGHLAYHLWIAPVLGAICSGPAELSVLKVMFNSAFLFLSRI
jgi:hypothetical protein